MQNSNSAYTRQEPSPSCDRRTTNSGRKERRYFFPIDITRNPCSHCVCGMTGPPDLETRFEQRSNWKDPDWWRSALLAYTIALIGGGIASQAGFPLPWMLGPFFACGVASGAGLTLSALPFGRETAQLIIGLGIGLRFTAATLISTLLLAPAMLVSTAYVIGYTMVAAFLFRPLARVNHSTAFFANSGRRRCRYGINRARARRGRVSRRDRSRASRVDDGCDRSNSCCQFWRVGKRAGSVVRHRAECPVAFASVLPRRPFGEAPQEDQNAEPLVWSRLCFLALFLDQRAFC